MNKNRKSAIAMMMVAGGLAAAIPALAATVVEPVVSEASAKGIAPCVKTKAGGIAPRVKTKKGELAPCVKVKGLVADPAAK